MAEMGTKTRQDEIEIQSNASISATLIMSDAEATSTAPRRSQRDKKQVERFGSGVCLQSRLSHGGISVFWIH